MPSTPEELLSNAEAEVERLAKRAAFDAAHTLSVAEGKAGDVLAAARKQAKKIIDQAKSDASGIARPGLIGRT